VLPTERVIIFFGGMDGGRVPGHHDPIGDWMIDVVHPSYVVYSMYGTLM
jgi:hypothetical protein